MAKKDRKTTTGARLTALLAVGDSRAARAEAARLLADPEAGEADKEAARAALARIHPERAAVAALAAGVVLYAFAAVFGLFWNR
jgi:hypothetical protein